MQELDCSKILNKWIVEVKKNEYEKHIKTENHEELNKYIHSLEYLEMQLNKAIINEDTERLKMLNWPNELMECIKDMNTRSELLDILREAFTVHYFNQSPKHEEELRNENK